MRIHRAAILSAIAVSIGPFIPAALGGFSVSFTSNSPLVVGPDSVWVVQAVNQGAAGGADTGSQLLAIELAITTPGNSTAGALVIQTDADINGDGLPDANILAAPVDTAGRSEPTYGSAIGTFIGYGGSAAGTSPDANGILVNPGNGLGLAYVNSQTSVNHTTLAPDGPIAVPGTPVIYESGEGLFSTSPAIDPAFTSGTVHSLEAIIFKFIDDSTDHSIANIVVPTGTPATVTVQLVGDIGPVQADTLTTPTDSADPVATAVGLSNDSNANAPVIHWNLQLPGPRGSSGISVPDAIAIEAPTRFDEQWFTSTIAAKATVVPEPNMAGWMLAAGLVAMARTRRGHGQSSTNLPIAIRVRTTPPSASPLRTQSHRRAIR
jgi:hypothetical protein